MRYAAIASILILLSGGAAAAKGVDDMTISEALAASKRVRYLQGFMDGVLAGVRTDNALEDETGDSWCPPSHLVLTTDAANKILQERIDKDPTVGRESIRRYAGQVRQALITAYPCR